jgi:hypothetical protein
VQHPYSRNPALKLRVFAFCLESWQLSPLRQLLFSQSQPVSLGDFLKIMGFDRLGDESYLIEAEHCIKLDSILKETNHKSKFFSGLDPVNPLFALTQIDHLRKSNEMLFIRKIVMMTWLRNV